ncbi:putative ABC transport system permease protein [Algoriphagus boseongensis]|uniref:Putative ABC transport system permease protein n=1 Tax=Algoriphagus boseongensis TaxID=1442587 RepID=A0A4R6T5V4_9BACT|nr:ABC transporter permease [Algoriphagus boseongensis]TDQ18498.1 putative ABC transport system permease protein [Algoriphagus boseongensis]
MLKNYFKIAIRNLFKHKLHTGINLIGLSLGLGVGILIFFFVQFELSFDSFHEDQDRIFRVKTHERIDGEMRETYASPVILAAAFRDEFPQIEAISGVTGADVQAILPDQSSQNQRLRLVDADFLKILNFPLLKGDISNQLQDKFSVVITEEVGEKYFGNENPIGKSIQLKMGEDFVDYQVTGVLQNPPANSSIPFEILMPIANMDFFADEESLASWYNVWGFNLVKLQSSEQVESIHQSMEAFMKKSLGEEYEEGGLYFSLSPISEMHFSQGAGNGGIETTQASLLWILAGIAFLVLLIACINFTTMAIGRATSRAKEVGVRKTMGASFAQLIGQFLTEAFLTTLMASIIGLVLAELLLPTFNDLFQKELDIVYGPVQFSILLGLILIITGLAGAYPAFFLSGLRPIKVLKGNLSIHFGKQGLRKGLVTFQFFISFLLIAATLIMVNQMNAIRNYDLGFAQDQILIVDMPDYPSKSFLTSLKESYRTAETFRQTLAARAEVASTAISVATYGDDAYWQVGYPKEDGTLFSFKVNFVAGDYLKTLGMELVEGRDLNPTIGADSSSFLINEAFAQAFDWDDPTGEMIPGTRFDPHQIVGVVKDFHHASLYQPIEPVLIAKSPEAVFSGISNLMINSTTNPKLLVQSAVGDLNQIKGVIEEEWNKMYAGLPLNITFMDETVQEQYQADERLGKMVFIASCIAILIASMGLLAMVALSIAGRTKEIGIRKVLGASGWSISWMFGKEYLVITALGLLVALPFSLYLMQGWVSQFAIKAWPSWLSFGLLSLGGIAFTLLIVYVQSLKASLSNPVNTLKDE